MCTTTVTIDNQYPNRNTDILMNASLQLRHLLLDKCGSIVLFVFLRQLNFYYMNHWHLYYLSGVCTLADIIPETCEAIHKVLATVCSKPDILREKMHVLWPNASQQEPHSEVHCMCAV